MKVEGKKLDFFSEKYERAMDAEALHVERFLRNNAQYNGSHAIDGGRDADVVRNITREIIEGQVDSRIPYPKVTSQCTDEGHVHNARCIERLCDAYTKRNHFQKFNDKDERYTYVFGASIYLVEFDSTAIEGNAVGAVEVRVVHPKYFAPQPGVEHIEDMDYLFIDIPLPREEVERRYGVDIGEDDGDRDLLPDSESQASEADEDMILVHVCYYKDEDGNVCQYVWTDDVELLSIDDYYARKVEICQTCGRRREICEKEPCEAPDYEEQSCEEEVLEEDILDEQGRVLIPAKTQVYKNGVPQFDEHREPVFDAQGRMVTDMIGGLQLPRMQVIQTPRLEPTRLPYYKPKRFPVVVRWNTSSIDGDWCGVSDCDVIRDQQILINKLESRMATKLLRSGVAAVVPQGAAVEEASNGIFERVIRLKPNQGKGQYGTISTEVAVVQDTNQAERQYDAAKKVAGITNAYQGQADTTAKSGKAKQIQIQQSAGRLESKRVMKNSAYGELYRIMFELSLAYADEPRPLCDKDDEGGACTVHFHRYAYYKFDKTSGRWVIDDNYIFEADYNGTPEEERGQMWELNMLNFEKGMFGDVNSNETRLRYWIKQEKARYPNAYEDVNYYRRLCEAERQQAAMMAAQQPPVPQAGPQAQPQAVTVQNPLMGQR